jgi:hypothetical protein
VFFSFTKISGEVTSLILKAMRSMGRSEQSERRVGV